MTSPSPARPSVHDAGLGVWEQWYSECSSAERGSVYCGVCVGGDGKRKRVGEHE